MDAAHGRLRAVELQGEFLVPGEVALLAILDPYMFVAFNQSGAFVDHELHFFELTLRCGRFADHEPSRLSSDHRASFHFLCA